LTSVDVVNQFEVINKKLEIQEDKATRIINLLNMSCNKINQHKQSYHLCIS
jgi:hypothetical protein